MDGFEADTFGKLNAFDYDQTQDPGTTAATVDFIASQVGEGRILELAIGSGRIGLPLAELGFDVSGIEASQEMVDLLRAKPGGQNIPVLIDDMANVAVDGPFDHVFLVFNTLFNLQSQDAQVRCFQNVAKQLRPGGTFMVETFVPRFEGFDNNQKVASKNLSMDGVWIEAVHHDPMRQTLDFQRIRFGANSYQMVPFTMRYAQPPELDLMAQLAGLSLSARYGGWHKEAFTARMQ